MAIKKHFAEVIESSLQSFKAQCWQWNILPTFGQLITIQNNQTTIFGIVYQIEMGSMDPVRYPFPYQKTEEELLREQPQIFEFLKTTFLALTLGYTQQGKIAYLLNPQPPKIHAFVSHATIDQFKEFFAQDIYLHRLFGASAMISNLDELLLVILKAQAELNLLSTAKLEGFIQSFSLLAGNDYRRLKLFLQRVQPLIDCQL